MISIGDFAHDDLGNVVGLWNACGLTRPWNDPATDIRLATTTETSTLRVAVEDAVIVGTIMVGFDGHRGWVYYLAVAPTHRKRGLGRALMQDAEAWLVSQGAPKIQLMVREDNLDALAFYGSLGLTVQPVVVLGRRFDA